MRCCWLCMGIGSNVGNGGVMGDFKRQIDLAILGFRHIEKKSGPAQIGLVLQVIEYMRELPLPPAYIDGIQSEVLWMLGKQKDLDTISVYLSFYGHDDRAGYLKIGIAKDVKSRMHGIATGNPVPRLWTYSAPFACKADAAKIEAALLAHMSPEKVHGEWVYMKGISEQASAAVVESLAEVATASNGHPVVFAREFF
jgi:hypothetical protein